MCGLSQEFAVTVQPAPFVAVFMSKNINAPPDWPLLPLQTHSTTFESRIRPFELLESRSLQSTHISTSIIKRRARL
jgi:hypothetical protein